MALGAWLDPIHRVAGWLAGGAAEERAAGPFGRLRPGSFTHAEAAVPTTWIATNLAGSLATKAIEDVWGGLDQLRGIDEIDAAVWLFGEVRYAAVEGVVGPLGGWAEAEAAVDRVLGREQDGRDVAAVARRAQVGAHQLSEEATPTVAGQHADGGDRVGRDLCAARHCQRRREAIQRANNPLAVHGTQGA